MFSLLLNNSLNQLKRYNREPKSQSEHNRVVKFIAEKLHSDEFQVTADHVFWPYGRPNIIRGHRPDIIAVKNSAKIIIEVETIDSFTDQHSIDQLISFSKGGIETHVIIPRHKYINASLRLLKDQISEHGLNVHVGVCDLYNKTVNFYL